MHGRGERELLEDVVHVARICLQHLIHEGCRLGTEGALVVGPLDDRHLRGLRPPDRRAAHADRIDLVRVELGSRSRGRRGRLDLIDRLAERVDLAADVGDALLDLLDVGRARAAARDDRERKRGRAGSDCYLTHLIPPGGPYEPPFVIRFDHPCSDT